MVALVGAARRHLPVALLSNAHDCLREDLRVLGLAGTFDAVICSAEVRLAKPDPAIYLHAAAALGVEPHRCFFTDDLKVNVAAAAGLGMRTHHFTGIAGLRRALSDVGVEALEGPRDSAVSADSPAPRSDDVVRMTP
jgi:FMN phosphatase YigB (HAD superfamily)